MKSFYNKTSYTKYISTDRFLYHIFLKQSFPFTSLYSDVDSVKKSGEKDSLEKSFRKTVLQP